MSHGRVRSFTIAKRYAEALAEQRKTCEARCQSSRGAMTVGANLDPIPLVPATKIADACGGHRIL